MGRKKKKRKRAEERVGTRKNSEFELIMKGERRGKACWCWNITNLRGGEGNEQRNQEGEYVHGKIGKGTGI